MKIAAKSFFVVGVAFTAEDTGFEGVAANAAISEEDDAVDDRGSVLVGRRSGSGLKASVKPANVEQFLKTVLASTSYWLTSHQDPEHHVPQESCRR